MTLLWCCLTSYVIVSFLTHTFFNHHLDNVSSITTVAATHNNNTSPQGIKHIPHPCLYTHTHTLICALPELPSYSAIQMSKYLGVFFSVLCSDTSNPVGPTEEQIQTVVSMGFSQDQALQALITTVCHCCDEREGENRRRGRQERDTRDQGE